MLIWPLCGPEEGANEGQGVVRSLLQIHRQEVMSVQMVAKDSIEKSPCREKTKCALVIKGPWIKAGEDKLKVTNAFCH